MPRRGRKNNTTDNAAANNGNDETATSNDEKEPVRETIKKSRNASKPKAAVAEESDSDEESEVEQDRPHRTLRDSIKFDRAGYIKPRDTPMISTAQRKEIQDMLLDDDNNNNDNDDSYYSDDNEDGPAETQDIIEVLENLSDTNNNLEMLSMMLVVNNLSDNLKAEHARIKAMSDNVDKLSKMIMRRIKKSDGN